MQLPFEKRKLIIIGIVIAILLSVIGSYFLLFEERQSSNHLVDYPETSYNHTVNIKEDREVVILEIETSKSDRIIVHDDVNNGTDEPVTVPPRERIEMGYNNFRGEKITYVSEYEGDKEIIGTVKIP